VRMRACVRHAMEVDSDANERRAREGMHRVGHHLLDGACARVRLRQIRGRLHVRRVEWDELVLLGAHQDDVAEGLQGGTRRNKARMRSRRVCSQQA
jgi:hypothetical protein